MCDFIAMRLQQELALAHPRETAEESTDGDQSWPRPQALTVASSHPWLIHLAWLLFADRGPLPYALQIHPTCENPGKDAIAMIEAEADG